MGNNYRNQSFAKPYVSGATLNQSDFETANQGEQQFTFPKLTSRIKVACRNPDDTAAVHFTSRTAQTVGDHVWNISGSGDANAVTLDVTAAEIWCSLVNSSSVGGGDADVQVFAELTELDTRSYFVTGSGLTDDSYLLGNRAFWLDHLSVIMDP